MNITLEIQRALSSRGYDLKADGAMGPITRAAIARFEALHGLRADGAPDAQLLKALGIGGDEPSPQQSVWMPWFDTAKGLLGKEEHRNKAEIAAWATAEGLGKFDATTTPWCGLFVGHCLATALPHEPQPSNPLGARNWLQFGAACEPTLGCVLVFWRGAKTGWSGHVAFYAGERADAFRILGGNQSDAVTETWIAKGRLLEHGARWPKTAARGATQTVQSAAGGALSTDEK